MARGNSGYGVRNGNVVGSGEVSGFITSSCRLCDEEMVRNLMQITKLGDLLDVVVKDEKRAINGNNSVQT